MLTRVVKDTITHISIFIPVAFTQKMFAQAMKHGNKNVSPTLSKISQVFRFFFITKL